VTTPVAVAIALGYGLAALAVVSGGRLWRPWLLGAFAAGALAFPLTVFLTASIQGLMVLAAGWGPDATAMTLGAGLAAVVVSAVINELFKLVAALAVWAGARQQAGVMRFGAAAGAGYGAAGAYQVIQLVLMARALPIGSMSGFVGSLVQQLAFVAMHSAATALAALGVARRSPGGYLAAVMAVETVYLAFGLFYEMRLYSNLVWSGLDVLVAAAVVAGASVAGRRQDSDAALASAA
jgi:hypothetical protein